MVPFCAKQGVEQKISFPDFLSAMLSDYECAYACGLAARKLGLSVDADMPLADIKDKVEAAIGENLSDPDYRVRNLYKLIRDYELSVFPQPQEEIPVLLGMGLESDFFDS